MKRHLIIIAILTVFAFSGCTKEVPVNTLPERFFTISLVSTQESPTRTPGEEQYNENRIEKIDIFFFDLSGNLLYYPASSQVTYLTDKIRLTIPEQEALALFGRDLTLYMIANGNVPRSQLEGKSLGEIVQCVHENRETFNASPFGAQSSFLMTGSRRLSNLSMTQTDLGSVTLQRAAAKVRVKITEAHVDGYTAVDAAVRINNYLDKTTVDTGPPALQASDYRHAAYRTLRLPEGTDSYYVDPFYSYANDWKEEPAKESYITIRVKWRHTDTGNEKYYYYRIPFNYIPPVENGEPNYCLQRNYIYTFNVNISALGGLDPEEMVDLEPNFELKDWTSLEIIAELNQYDFLVVAEHYVEMHDINLRLIHYTSSKPVTIRLDSAYYYQYLSDGKIIRKDLSGANGGFYPTITADAVSSNIVVNCNVPINYVPTHMQFTVINGRLTQKVRVVQYPRQYLTSAFSNRNDINFSYYTSIGQSSFWENSANGGTNMTNFNLYTITTTSLAATDNFVLGGDMTARQNLFPYNNLLATKPDEATNRMISPKFVVASQRGIYSLLSYNYAAHRCSLYSEGKYPVGTWRIPTVAEMALIVKLQNDPYSALSNLFVPANSSQGRWWTARREGTTYYVYNIGTGSLETTTSSSATYAVRCVHDVWKDE